MPGACRLRALARAGRGGGARLPYPITPRPGASRCCPPAERRGRIPLVRGTIGGLARRGPARAEHASRYAGARPLPVRTGRRLGSKSPATDIETVYCLCAGAAGRLRPALRQPASKGAGHEAEALSGRLRIADNRQPSVQDGWPQKMQLRFRILSLSVCVVIGGRASRARRRHPLVGPPRFGLFVPADHRIARSVGLAIEIPHRCPPAKSAARAGG